MLKKYQVYIFIGIFQSFLITGFILLGIFFITQLFGIFTYIGGLGISFKDILIIFFLTIPNFLYYFSLPLSMLAIIIFYKKLHDNNEFIILLSSGIKISNILVPAKYFILLITVFSLYNSFYLLPITKFQIDKKLNKILVNNSIKMLKKPGLNIIKDNFVVLVKEGQKNNPILIYKEREDKNYIISANSLTTDKNKLIFTNGVIIPGDEKGNDSSLIKFKKSIIDPSFLLNTKNIIYKNYKEFTITELLNTIKRTDRLKYFNMYIVEINRRLLFALVNLFIVWVALIPIVTSKRYSGNNSFYILPVLFLIIFYVVSSIGRNLIYKGNYMGILVSWSIILFSFLFTIIVKSKVKKRT